MMYPLIVSDSVPLNSVPINPPVSLTSSQSTCSKPAQKYVPFQRGIASWYGSENKTSSTGKRLRHDVPEIAHKTLPIGTRVRVTSLKTKRTVLAVVVDRGPYVGGRIADLNYSAAKQLGLIKTGIDRVRLDVLDRSKI
jgi:rare lipoprotein A